MAGPVSQDGSASMKIYLRAEKTAGKEEKRTKGVKTAQGTPRRERRKRSKRKKYSMVEQISTLQLMEQEDIPERTELVETT